MRTILYLQTNSDIFQNLIDYGHNKLRVMSGKIMKHDRKKMDIAKLDFPNFRKTLMKLVYNLLDES
jgi:hypothetical protein